MSQHMTKQIIHHLAICLSFLVLFTSVTTVGMRPAEAAPFAYAVNNGSDTISVLDLASNSVDAIIPLPAAFVHYIAIAQNGEHLYVTGSGSILVIETSSNTIANSINLEGGVPGDIALSPDGAYAYVTDQSGRSRYSRVLVVDLRSNSVIDTIDLFFVFPNNSLAIAPDGKHVYVTTSSPPGNITVIDTTSNTVSGTITLPPGSAASSIAFTPDGALAYATSVAGDLSASVLVIDTSSNTVVSIIPYPWASSPDEIAITPDGKRAYVTNFYSETFRSHVSIIDTISNTLLDASIELEPLALGLAITANGKTVYVTNGSFSPTGIVSVIETAQNTIVANIPVGERPEGIVITPLVALSVDIDIKPGSKQNVINPRSRGSIWVAVLSDTDSDSFLDPSSRIDNSTLSFGPDGAEATSYRVIDINADGLGDLLVRFKISDTGIDCGNLEAALTGETFDGQRIMGRDSIMVVGCENQAAPN